MRKPLRMLGILVLFACSDRGLTQIHRRGAPETLSVDGSVRAIGATGAAPELEVAASLRNETHSRIQVAVGERCPLFVRIYPDPTGEAADSLSGSWACAPGGPTLDLAPGDTAVLTRVFSADTLATFAPGRYAVSVAVTTNTYLIGVRAGTVQLPLP